MCNALTPGALDEIEKLRLETTRAECPAATPCTTDCHTVIGCYPLYQAQCEYDEALHRDAPALIASARELERLRAAAGKWTVEPDFNGENYEVVAVDVVRETYKDGSFNGRVSQQVLCTAHGKEAADLVVLALGAIADRDALAAKLGEAERVIDAARRFRLAEYGSESERVAHSEFVLVLDAFDRKGGAR